MKKTIFVLAALYAATFANAQTYTIVSRGNDTIKLQSNKIGDALKNVVPGKSTDIENNYRLIEKTWNGKKSLLFVEFTQVLDKVFVAYETDLIHAGDWSVSPVSFSDIYASLKRENAILLKGELLGMKIEVYQRPDNFKDIINIDGIEFPSPIKVNVIENKIAEEIQSKKNEKSAELLKLSLRETDVEQTKGKANECYIAYLLKMGSFNKAVDRTLMNDLCNQDDVAELGKKYNEEQLNYLSNGFDSRLKKYSK